MQVRTTKNAVIKETWTYDEQNRVTTYTDGEGQKFTYAYTEKTVTEKTYSIHHYSASWTSAVTKRTTRIKRIMGVKLYNKIYGKFLQKCKWLEW